MMSLSDDKQTGIIDALNLTSRSLDDILNINNIYFDNMVSQIYPQSSNLIKVRKKPKTRNRYNQVSYLTLDIGK